MRALWLTLALTACWEDPILQRAEDLEALDKPAAKSGAAPVEAGTPEQGMEAGIPDETITPGVPEDPDPVQAEDPAPGVPEDPEPAPPGFKGGNDSGGEGVTPGVPEEPDPAPVGSPGGAEHEGKTDGLVGPRGTLTGTVSMDESIKAKIYIDIFDGDQRNHAGPRPSLVTVQELQGAGAFKIEVPLSAKRVWLSAYADINGDKRPTKGEPTGWFPGNPVHLESPPDRIKLELVADKKPVGLGLDFGG